MPRHPRRMRRRNRVLRPVRGRPVSDPIGDLLALWLLRMLVHSGALEQVAGQEEEWDSRVLEALGIESHPEPEDEQPRYRRGLDLVVDHDDPEATLQARLQVFQERLEALEGSSTCSPEHNRLLANVYAVSARLRLSDLESRLLALLALETLEEGPFSSVFGTVRAALRADAAEAIALALAEPTEAVRAALHREGTLARSGLVQGAGRRRGPHMPEETGYELLEGLPEALIGEQAHADGVFRAYIRAAEAPGLSVRDFGHLQGELEQVATLLARAAEQGEQGINILIHGPPGTGKTELARLAAAQAGLQAHAINHEMGDGTPLEPRGRQRAYQLAQHLLERDEGSVIIFDEIEDVFGFRGLLGLLLGSRSEGRGGKAWTNHMLETNPVPALWLTNTPQELDPAYLRRFAHVVEVRAPDPSVRAEMIAEACEGLPVSRAWIERAAETEGLTPAEIRNATRVARLVEQDGDPSAVEEFLDQHLRRQCRLQGRQPPRRRRGAESLGYDLAYINADPNPEATVESLLALGDGSVLLHGPPGTGKTALAEHIARQAGRSLMSHPASALLSRYVGQTEKNLAQLFDTAQERGAVLLIDEADSLLRTREGARASWEVTQTNELLVQLEAFEGIVLCATNHLEALDAAALRRFDHKLELRPLRPPQRRALLDELMRATGADAGEALSEDDEAAIQRRLERLDGLTPGDYATVARRWRRCAAGQEPPSVADLLEALEAEERVKPGHGQRSIGFV